MKCDMNERDGLKWSLWEQGGWIMIKSWLGTVIVVVFREELTGKYVPKKSSS